MRLLLALLIAVVIACAPHAAPVHHPEAPELKYVDVFGSRRLDREALLSRWGDQLAEYVRAAAAQREEAHDLAVALERELRTAGGFAFVELSAVTYYEPKATYLTIDLVDPEDRARRMTFEAPPSGTHDDPDGLIALWGTYEQAFFELLQRGELGPATRCPFWHCLSFDHATLAPYREQFALRVPAVEGELASVLRDDARPVHRATAAFLLAHLTSGVRVVELELSAIRDPETLVRNNALRVLALIAQDHPEIAIPVDPILAALDRPTTVDRNKAAAILDGIVKGTSLTSAQRDHIRRRSGEVLVDMLGLRQPNNHDFAYSILKHLAGRDFGETALAEWRAWVRS